MPGHEMLVSQHMHQVMVLNPYSAIFLLHLGPRLLLAILLTGRLFRAVQRRPQQLQLAGKEVGELVLSREMAEIWQIRWSQRRHGALPYADAIISIWRQVPGLQGKGMARQESVLPSELPPAHVVFPQHQPGVIRGQPWLSGIHDSGRRTFSAGRQSDLMPDRSICMT